MSARSKSDFFRKQDARLAHKRAVRTATILHNLKKSIRADLAVILDPPPVVCAVRARSPHDLPAGRRDAHVHARRVLRGQRVEFGGGAAPSIVVERVS